MRRWTTSTATDEADVADPEAMALLRPRSPPTSIQLADRDTTGCDI